MPEGAKLELIGPVAGLAVAEPDVVDHELAVDGIGDRLANLLIVQSGLLGVDQQLDHGADHLVALGGHLDRGQLRQLLGVAVGHGPEARHVRFALLQRSGARCLVVDEAHDDAIEIRQPLAPVVRVLVEAHEFAAPPLDELEGAGADRAVGVGVGLDVALAEDVLGQHRALVARQRRQHVGRGVVELEDRRVVVGRFDRRDVAEGADAARMRLLQHLHDGELHVGGREGLAVVEFHVLAQLEGDGLAVGRNLPAFGQARFGLEVEAVFEQPVVDLGRHLADRRGGRDVGGEIWRLRLRDLHQRAAGLLGGGRRAGDRQGQQPRQSKSAPTRHSHDGSPVAIFYKIARNSSPSRGQQVWAAADPVSPKR